MSIRKQYDTDLESLKESLTEMGRSSADAVENALEALCVADADAAAAIVKGDARINNMERDIEHRCMTLLLRHAAVSEWGICEIRVHTPGTQYAGTALVYALIAIGFVVTIACAVLLKKNNAAVQAHK